MKFVCSVRIIEHTLPYNIIQLNNDRLNNFMRNLI